MSSASIPMNTTLRLAFVRLVLWIKVRAKQLVVAFMSFSFLIVVATASVAQDAATAGSTAQVDENCKAMATAAEAAMANHVSIVNRFMNNAQSQMNKIVSNKCISTIANLNFDLSNLIPDFGLLGTLLNVAIERFTSMIIGKVCAALSSVVDGWNDVVAGITGDFRMGSGLETWATSVNTTVPPGWGGGIPAPSGDSEVVDLIKPNEVRPPNPPGMGSGGGGGGEYTDGPAPTPTDNNRCSALYQAWDDAKTRVQWAYTALSNGTGDQAGITRAREEARRAEAAFEACERDPTAGSSGGSGGSGNAPPSGMTGAQIGADYARYQQACSQAVESEVIRMRQEGTMTYPPSFSQETRDLCRAAENFYSRWSQYLGSQTPGIPSEFKSASAAKKAEESIKQASKTLGIEPARTTNSSGGFSLPVRQ